jgi:hypothetical protein
MCTGGLFGLWYGYQVCSAYRAQGGKRTTDSAGRPLGTVRHPLWVLALAYLTLGFYLYYWIYRVMGECAAYSGRTDFNARTELTLMLIFPPYALFVAVVRLPEMIRATQDLAKVQESTAIRYSFISFIFLTPATCLGLPFLGMVYQDALNQVWLSPS